MHLYEKLSKSTIYKQLHFFFNLRKKKGLVLIFLRFYLKRGETVCFFLDTICISGCELVELGLHSVQMSHVVVV